MRILAIERELPAPAHFPLSEMLQEEAAAVWSLVKLNVIRDIWFTTADHCAIIMLECADAAEAQRHLATLPLVRADRFHSA